MMTSSTGEISQAGINNKLKEIIHEIELEVGKDADNTGLASAEKVQINLETGASTKGAAPSSTSPGGGSFNSASTPLGSISPSETISKRPQASETAGKGHSSRVRVIPVRIVGVESETTDSCSDARRFVPREERDPVLPKDMSEISAGGFGEDGDHATHSVPGQTLQGTGGHYPSGHYAEDELSNHHQFHQSATAMPYNPSHIRTGQWKSANPAMEQTFVKREFQCMPESADRATLQHHGDAPVLGPADHLVQTSSGEERKHDQCATNRESTPQGWSERSKSGSQVLQRRSSFGSHSSIPKKVHFAEEPEVKIYETVEAESTPEDLLPQFNVDKNEEEEEEQEDSDEDDGELIVHELKEDMWKEEDVEGYGEAQDSGQEAQKQDDVDTDPRSVQTEHLVEEDQRIHDQSGIERLSEKLDKQVDQSEQNVKDKQGMLHCDGNNEYDNPLMTNSGEEDFSMLNPAESSPMDHQSSQLPNPQPLSHHLPPLKNEAVPSYPQIYPTLQLPAPAPGQSPFRLLPTAETRPLMEHVAEAGSQPIQRATEAASFIEQPDMQISSSEVGGSPSAYPEAHSSVIYPQQPDPAFQTRESTQVSSATNKPDAVGFSQQYSFATEPSNSSTSLYSAPTQLSFFFFFFSRLNGLFSCHTATYIVPLQCATTQQRRQTQNTDPYPSILAL
ncbi:uncharacterized protein LOC122377068 [Amphibalanus amphitrite]|uniref:uncharacterized protein LOC122377068 n=1 Tax=Amphibalanus amphitrite TaxID=1232801 RepID=UPI001C9202E4|nr:uncharacterized protein LOC122377068 [Amphibalanus amphitrite]XP_043212964.1 uncharacterized protein LOC122377068 [Amphibalanus amphitrite]